MTIVLSALEILAPGCEGKYIYICTDSQTAIIALTSQLIKSKLIEEYVQTLNRLWCSNQVKILLVPGYLGIHGNDGAGELAQQGSSKYVLGPAPFSTIRINRL